MHGTPLPALQLIRHTSSPGCLTQLGTEGRGRSQVQVNKEVRHKVDLLVLKHMGAPQGHKVDLLVLKHMGHLRGTR